MSAGTHRSTQGKGGKPTLESEIAVHDLITADSAAPVRGSTGSMRPTADVTSPVVWAWNLVHEIFKPANKGSDAAEGVLLC